MKRVLTSVLDLAYEEFGAPDGSPVVLLHGFPYSVHAYDAVAPALAGQGCRVIVPHLRGYGPTRFRDEAVPRSGQQAAHAVDLRDLIDAIGLERPILAGFDWGGRAACIVAALWPERVAGLVSAAGYSIQNIPASVEPAAPEYEHQLWYQYYFHTPRGRAGLERNRHALGKLLWRLWSPSWRFDDASYDRTAACFDNPDFVDVVIQSYRHRFGYCEGDPELEPIERELVRQPEITVPTIVLHGAEDTVTPVGQSEDLSRFTGPCRREILAGTGHSVPQEAPEAVIGAVLELRAGVLEHFPSRLARE